MADEHPRRIPVPAKRELTASTPLPPHPCASPGSRLRNDGERVRRREVSRRKPWQRVARLVRGRHQRYDSVAARLRQLDEVLEVLATARSVVEDGWVQDAWFAVRRGSRPAPAPPAAMVSSSLSYPDRDDLAGACLVGAVVHAVRLRHPGDARAEVDGVGPAIDVLWDALQESRGLGSRGVAGRVAPPAVRAARVRDLTRWNDRRGRSRGDVLDLLDLASSRTVMAAMTTSEQVAVGG
jgi:hypothetical protein